MLFSCSVVFHRPDIIVWFFRSWILVPVLCHFLVKSVITDCFLQDDGLNKLQKSFQSRLVKMFGSDLHPSLPSPPSSGSDLRPREDVSTESRMKELRKRLRQFLLLSLTEPPASKRTKTDTMQEWKRLRVSSGAEAERMQTVTDEFDL